MTVKEIILHHSAGIDTSADNWEKIRKFHIEERGWSDIGYHAGIELVGPEYKIRYGRPLNKNGAHCPGKNSVAVGFCFVGDFTNEPPPLGMVVHAAREFFIPVMNQYHLSLADISCHRDHRATECPGKAFDIGIIQYVIEGLLKDAR